jgi:uncharacterized cupredoxin-like copper-binding protein
MTATKEQGEKAIGGDRPGLGRTFAMRLVGAGYGVMTASIAYFLIAIALPAADDPNVAAVIPRMIAITAIIGAIGGVTVIWSGARSRPWFWLAVAVPAVLFLLMNAPHTAYDITRPADTERFLTTIFVLAGELAIISAGITAFLEVRRSRVSWTRSGRAGWVSLAVVGALIGAVATSALAGSAVAGAAVAEEPTITGVLTAGRTAFSETRLQMKDGGTLGLFLINRDSIDHSFDIDSLDIHVQMPPNSTTAVAVKPAGPGILQFFCAVPGHEDAGMVGTIEVEA